VRVLREEGGTSRGPGYLPLPAGRTSGPGPRFPGLNREKGTETG